MSTISVLINCFNYRSFVVEAVESALGQTRLPSQVIVVDDGSTDDSVELLMAKFSGNPKVEIVRKQNRGQLSAMVAGFKHSTGDFIFFLDADDRYQPDHVERVMALFEARKDVDFVFTGLQEFGDSTRTQLFDTRDHYLASSVIRSLHTDEFLGAATSAISCRRWVIDAMLPVLDDVAPQWRIRADDCLVRGSSAVGARKYFSAATTVGYRVHGANSYANKPLDAAHHSQHWLRTMCYMNRVKDHVGLTRYMIRWAHKEFVHIPEPRYKDFESYWLLVKSATHLSWPVKWGMWWRMRQHFKRHGRA